MKHKVCETLIPHGNKDSKREGNCSIAVPWVVEFLNTTGPILNQLRLSTIQDVQSVILKGVGVKVSWWKEDEKAKGIATS